MKHENHQDHLAEEPKDRDYLAFGSDLQEYAELNREYSALHSSDSDTLLIY